MNPVSEKILYFVIYILELAVYTIKETKRSSESATTENIPNNADQSDESNFENWFKSNDIAENLYAVVPFPTRDLKDQASSDTASNSKSASSTRPRFDSDAAYSSSSESTSGASSKSSNKPPYKKICSGTGKLILKPKKRFRNK